MQSIYLGREHGTGRLARANHAAVRGCYARPVVRGAISMAVILGCGCFTCQATDEIERPPIEYSQCTPDNCVANLAARLAANESHLEYDERTGYLASLLNALEVPVESQMLVFSKTSLQRHRISPRSPRAIYFNDDVYVGYCRSGDVLEITAVDPRLGAVFYTLDQKNADEVRLLRQTENCLVCHSSSRTDGVPGHLARSLFVDASGQPILSAGSRGGPYNPLRAPLGWLVRNRHAWRTKTSWQPDHQGRKSGRTGRQLRKARMSPGSMTGCRWRRTWRRTATSWRYWCSNTRPWCITELPEPITRHDRHCCTRKK